ncbi:MAG: hypothetical protein B6D64_03600 [Bacteroidetes bacterium 4484_276]|nr:MAG: hypothetical protein B6D64_03600 [Bacteroidetes bacterium 4484_276]OYT14132.1 MAG: hypothetical protein B6I19_01520 [Bacteroidetes bacterium 4572_114]
MLKVISVEPKESHILFIRLSNGKEGEFDVTPYLDRGIFTELKNESYFKQASPCFYGIAWPQQQDFSADTIECEMR